MKALNVFGIIFAWFLSIALVIMLIAAPLLLSTLSMLDPKNIVEVVTDGLTESQESAEADLQKEHAFQKLSVSSKEKSLAESVLEALNLEEIEDIVGQKVDEKVVAEVLASDAMTDIFEAYANDIANALTGESGKRQFTSKKIVELVQDNLDEIIEAVEDAGVTMSKSEKEEIKGKINSAVKENADKIVDLLPAPEEIAETFVEDNEIGENVAMLFARKNMVKLAIVGIIVVLSLLIFFLRYPGFRGMRWLASDLFTAGGFNVIVCLVLGVGSSAIKGLAEGIDNSAVDGIVSKLLTQLTTGVVIRTVIMLVAAALLLVAYYLLKNFKRKKKTAPVATAPVAAPAPENIVPEIVAEPAPETVEEPASAENEN